MLRFLQILSILILASILALGLMSCGGSGSPSQNTGGVRLTVKWPATRDIPPATRSLRITATTLVKSDGGTKVEDKSVGSRIVVRPENQTTSTVTLDDLPSVEVRVKVLAYASTDATGDPLAIGLKDATISSGSTTSIAITLHADVASIESDPESVTMEVGQTRSITMTAKELDGSITLIADSRFTYTSENTSIATVAKRSSPNGHIADITGVANGTTSIEVTDSTTGVSTTVPVTVQASSLCSSYFATAEGHTDTGFEDASVSGAYGFPHASFISIFGGGSAEGRAKSYVRVKAPTRVGPFSIEFETQVELKDENPDGTSANSGQVSITWPGGSDTASSFFEGVRVKTHSIAVQHGDVLLIELVSKGTCGSDTGVTAIGDLIFNQPTDVDLEVLTCGVDE
jgi:hypothetical protein